MKAIFKLNAYCGRNGFLEGVFVEDTERVNALIESKIEVQFGEVLGKHSFICGSLNKDEIIFVTDSKEAIDVVEKLGLSTGHNPFNYLVGEVPDILLDEKQDDWFVSEACDAYIKKTKIGTKGEY